MKKVSESVDAFARLCALSFQREGISPSQNYKPMKKTITITSSHQAGHNVISLDGFEDITYISDLAPELECFDVIKNILDCYGLNLEVQAQTGNDYHCATPEND